MCIITPCHLQWHTLAPPHPKHPPHYHYPVPTQPDASASNVHTINSRALGLSLHPLLTSFSLLETSPHYCLPSADLSAATQLTYTHTQTHTPGVITTSKFAFCFPRNGGGATGIWLSILDRYESGP